MATQPPYGGRNLLADSSAWTALKRARKLGNVPPDWTAAIEADQIWTSPVVKIELYHSARNRIEFDEWQDELDVLHEVHMSRVIADAALGALRELAAKSDGYHRVGLGDALIAASAQAGGIGVLHYNHEDFRKLREVLVFDNVPLATPGTFETKPELAAWRVALIGVLKAAIRRVKGLPTAKG